MFFKIKKNCISLFSLSLFMEMNPTKLEKKVIGSFHCINAGILLLSNYVGITEFNLCS
jgi:hypothetical protein